DADASGTTCSTNATCRQESALSSPVLSYDRPRKSNPSAGTSFHSLHATSQALHPMHSVVSVKNPTRAGAASTMATSSRTTARPDVARRSLHLLDVHVRIQREREEVVGGVAGREAARPPVVRQPDLVD